MSAAMRPIFISVQNGNKPKSWKGVANGLSKMLSLGKFTPSLGISALKNSVSESRISGNMRVSESRILKIWISESQIDFENLDLKISPIFYPQAYPKREIKKFTPAGICIYNCYVKYIQETVISTL